MIGNRTNELRISEPLRGFIKHQSNRAYIDGGQASWLTKIADEIDAKHEQAVAATLGSDDEYESKMDALLCRLTNGKWSKSRSYDLDFMVSCVDEEFEDLYAKELAYATLGNGTLTAEQVREAIYRHSTYNDIYKVYQVSHADMQAIADELNATLKSEPPYDELIRCLENDWHIHASWDGLRKFWCIELTEEGVKLRDSLNEVADKWASEKIKAEDYARENMMLKANNGSRWHELFGTPERAARTLDALCGEIESCDHCEMKRTIGGCGSYDALLEWLKGGNE